MLPHSTALVAPYAPDAMLAASRILDDEDPPDALFALLHRLHLPVALSALGMPEDGVDEAARRRRSTSDGSWSLVSNGS